MIALPLVTLHLALPRLLLPCIAYQIHCFANSASAYKLDQHISCPGCLSFALWLWSMGHHPRRSPTPRRCQRRLLCVFWQQHISNHSIRERTKQPTASSLLRQRRLRWFGHLHRKPSSLPVRRVYGFNPNIHGWKRPRGCPKTRWADSIKHDLNSAGLDTINAAQMVFDRPQWKAFVSGLPTLEPEQLRLLSQVSQVSQPLVSLPSKLSTNNTVSWHSLLSISTTLIWFDLEHIVLTG